MDERDKCKYKKMKEVGLDEGWMWMKGVDKWDDFR